MSKLQSMSMKERFGAFKKAVKKVIATLQCRLRFCYVDSLSKLGKQLAGNGKLQGKSLGTRKLIFLSLYTLTEKMVLYWVVEKHNKIFYELKTQKLEKK